MIYSLKGELVHLEPKIAVISCGGVGFRCQITMNTARQLPAIGKEAFLYTMMNVREDAIELFGFAQPDELSCFKMLTSVSGVGSKVGLSILSALSPEKVALAVATGDFKALTKAAGVGPKLAQRIALELKEKITDDEVNALPQGMAATAQAAHRREDPVAEAMIALQSLGYSQGEAMQALSAVKDKSDQSDELVRLGVRGMM